MRRMTQQNKGTHVSMIGAGNKIAEAAAATRQESRTTCGEV